MKTALDKKAENERRLQQYTGFNFIIQREISRYKGFSKSELIFRIAYDLVFAISVPYFMRPIWIWVLGIGESTGLEKWQWSFILSVIVNLGTLTLGNLMFYFIYTAKKPIFDKRKIFPDVWPWEQNYQEWRELLSKTIKTLLLNNVILAPGVIYIGLVLNNFEVLQSFEVEKLPSPLTFYLHLLFCLIVDDLMFTISHRILHYPAIYKRVHKQHHTYIQTISICAEYAHPLEFVFGNVIPAAAGSMILGSRMHYAQFMFMTTYKVLGTTFGHSGYEFRVFPYELFPFKTNVAFHDFHHSNNVGNYGGFMTLWDDLFGYSRDYYAHLDKKKIIDEKKDQ